MCWLFRWAGLRADRAALTYGPFGCDDARVAIFTPDTEPYLGGPLLHQFDTIIVAALEQHHAIGPWTRAHRDELSRLQRAACQIIPSSCSIALGIRELIRQAYLFPAHMLLRPLIERVATISYLAENPAALDLWEEGWPYSKRPKLPDLLRSMTGQLSDAADDAGLAEAKTVANYYNALVHGDPLSAPENVVMHEGNEATFSVSKDVDSPERADNLAVHGAMYMIVLMARAAEIFPDVAE